MPINPSAVRELMIQVGRPTASHDLPGMYARICSLIIDMLLGECVIAKTQKPPLYFTDGLEPFLKKP
jgi:hypothetical protein